ncbi:hypothetical protein X474_19160 [Dethiosulfatarculus sandiegensis]|uniref:Uncharacterized protein n=1 Tax=Dethiosulfatarculus sandiegensis TaxID=1429043 RepID=A0A0D2HPP1_9BACT|nr:hypothetical protein X474_19160 [Dethiosulfatarculus sandiegensis]
MVRTCALVFGLQMFSEKGASKRSGGILSIYRRPFGQRIFGFTRIKQRLSRRIIPLSLLLAGALGAYLCLELGVWLIWNYNQPWPFFMDFELLDWIEYAF